MDRPAFELADVVRRHGDAFRAKVPTSPQQRRVLDAVLNCRSAALGGHVDGCSACGHQEVSYNSCRNRHCPKCQSADRHRWLQDRLEDLLPVPYFHVVFTLPEELGPLALQNPKPVYDLLFKAVGRSLLTIAADPKHLGARVGFIALLHTWGQNLLLHPHLHCVVPAGGFALDKNSWVPAREGFLLPVRVLSRFFRRVFLRELQTLFDGGKLQFHGRLSLLAGRGTFARFINDLGKTEWVVYAKPPFGSPAHVLRYLGRYTHRVAISNHRIVNVADDHVAFRWKDYRDPGQPKTMSLPPTEFLRRFLLHTLPTSFVRIRHFGFLANRSRVKNIAKLRGLLGQACPNDPPDLPAALDAPPFQAPGRDDPSPDAMVLDAPTEVLPIPIPIAHPAREIPEDSTPVRSAAVIHPSAPATGPMPCPRCLVGKLLRREIHPRLWGMDSS